jgi:hypothetical protein
MWDDVLAFVGDRLRDHDGSHDVQHALSVARNADLICSDDNARRACVLAALFHDVCDRKYVDDPDAVCAAIHRFLQAHVSSTEARVVCSAIRWISFTRLRAEGPPPLGGDERYVWSVVSDADMLEAMGLTGVLRTLIYQGRVRRPADQALTYARLELVRCIEHMTHAVAIVEARRRLSTMDRVIAQMRRAPSGGALRPAAHLCVEHGRRGTAFNEIVGLLNQKRYFDAFSRAELARERAWQKTARADESDGVG